MLALMILHKTSWDFCYRAVPAPLSCVKELQGTVSELKQ